MSESFPYTVNGRPIQVQVQRRGKTRISARVIRADQLRISAPPAVPLAAIRRFVTTHHDAISTLLAKAPPPPSAELPPHIWYQGQTYPVMADASVDTVCWDQHSFRLPETDVAQQKAWLRQFLYRQAQQQLLPQLQAHSQRLQLMPAATALSRAKTLWGVCHRQTGIRLNWRLIGAPVWVVDYVAIHELCHLAHPNHSPAFWALVAQHTPHTRAAKQWLRQHGPELFAVDEVH